MLSKCFSYYNYKITQNIDIPILFSKKIYFFISGNIPLKNYTFARILL